MSLNIFWFLPTHGDGHYLGTAEGARAVDHGYLQQVAQAADRLGFGGVLIPLSFQIIATYRFFGIYLVNFC